MTVDAGFEDERGVDSLQVRELLALTPAARSGRLVATAEVWAEIIAQAGRLQGVR